MAKEKKESIFKRIFSSKDDCCSVEFEEVGENNEEVQNKEKPSKN